MLSFLFRYYGVQNLKGEKYSSLHLHAYRCVYAFLHMVRKKNDKKRFSNFIQSDIMVRRWKRENEMPVSEYD